MTKPKSCEEDKKECPIVRKSVYLYETQLLRDASKLLFAKAAPDR